VIDPSVLHLLLLAVTGWLDRRERAAIAQIFRSTQMWPDSAMSKWMVPVELQGSGDWSYAASR
jgi:hypothetical protein